MIAVLMPTTRPVESTSGPPELRVERRVGLNDVIDEVAGDASQCASECGNHTRRDCRFKAERASNGDRELTDLELRGVPQNREGKRLSLGLDDREVRSGIVSDHAPGHLRTVV